MPAQATQARPYAQPVPVQQQPAPQRQPVPVANEGMQEALGYLDKVKMRFGGQPGVYSTFLDIMKQFKSHTIDTEGVIDRVKSLFHGHPELILGFNQFLPPGFEIRLEPEVPAQAAAPVPHNVPARPQQPVPVESSPTALPRSKPTMEFNHAVSYVAKIKQRFDHAPEIYEQFLQILHAYQENKSSDEAIDRVKSRVQQLFYGHSDLLDEFAYFLPEMAAKNRDAAPQKSTSLKRKRTQQIQRAADYTGDGFPNRYSSGSSTVSATSISADGKKTAVAFPPDSKRELNVIQSIKSAVSRAMYVQFLRCLNLFSKKIVNRSDLVLLLEDLFATFATESPKLMDLLERFKDIVLDYRDYEDTDLEDLQRTNYFEFLCAMNTLKCPQITESYRELPADLPMPPCSGRDALGDKVLNGTLVSVATGTEDGGYEASRKNEFEEALFRIEDEQYEVDMLIETTKSAIRALERVIDDMPAREDLIAQRKLIENQLEMIHVDAIAKIYADQWHDVLTAFRENPCHCAPFILRRLQTKVDEWTEAKKELTSRWRADLSRNYLRALDQRSFFFKQSEKKTLNYKTFLAQLREVNAASGKIQVSEDVDSSVNGLAYSFGDDDVHKLSFDCILRTAKSSYSAVECDKLENFWNEFVNHFFGTEGGAAIHEKEKAMYFDSAESLTFETKPIRMMADSWDTQEKISPIRRHDRPSRLFYGNTVFYVFFRYYQLLYIRIAKCKQLAELRGPEVFQQFSDLLLKYVDGAGAAASGSVTVMQALDFEDALRTLLGTKSYPLFTVDKLVSNILKQVWNILMDADNVKLISLYFYESVRSKDDNSPHSLDKSALLARMYLSNCTSILNEENSCIRVEYVSFYRHS